MYDLINVVFSSYIGSILGYTEFGFIFRWPNPDYLIPSDYRISILSIYVMPF